jgi:predicted MPP superfamily phosphohydrolase
MNRRTFIHRTFWGLTGLSSLTGLYTLQIEPFWLEFVRVKMEVRNLPRTLVGKTLAQISDIHVGNRFDHRFIIDSFRKPEVFRTDFVVYTGDYISMSGTVAPYAFLDDTLAHIVRGKLESVDVACQK